MNGDDNLMASEVEDINNLRTQIQSSQMPDELKEKALGLTNRLAKLVKYGNFSKEFEPIEQYIFWLNRLPWGKYTTDILDLAKIKAQLDSTHYGLEVVKERILEYSALLNLQKQKQIAGSQDAEGKGTVLCFVGVQGIGKTSIAKSIAFALGRKFVRISLGGLASSNELRGINKYEVNAEPGQVIKALIRTESMNPLILLDEVDKVSGNINVHADIMAVLLEILDPEQNKTFSDHYIDYPVDLSKCMFICTANNLGGISAALLDRLEVIRMTSYTDDEKIHIARDYLLPKLIREAGLNKDQIVFSPDVWPLAVRPLGFDPGIRQLERNLTTFVRKVAKKIVTGEGQRFEVNLQNFREYIPMDIGVYS